MGFFNNFPYTNFHELNLDWILSKVREHENRIKELGDNFDAIEKENEQFREEMRNYLLSLDIPAEVEKKLKEMFDNGELSEVVYRVLTEDVLRDITNNFKELEKVKGFVPTGDDHVDYVNDTLRCVASYLAHNVDSSSVIVGETGTTNVDVPFAAYYANGQRSYLGALGQGSHGFVTTDKTEVNGVKYPTAYLDCSCFVSLITKCRFYGDDLYGEKNESPYHYAFKNNLPGDDGGVLGRCTEAGDHHTKAYTMDFQNYISSPIMAYMMDSGGNRLRVFCTREAGAQPVFVDSVAESMETGDILFFAAASEDRYKKIGHCGYYIRDIAELNKFGARYNITFKPSRDGYRPELGYVVHVSTSLNESESWKDVMRIDTLYDIMNLGRYNKAFVARPYSNAFISNKARRLMDFRFSTYNDIRMVYRYTTGNSLPGDRGYDGSGYVKTANVAIPGTVFVENEDLNNIENGVFRAERTAVITTLSNAPAYLVEQKIPFTVLQFGRRTGSSGSALGLQLVFSNSGSNARMYLRSCNFDNTWSGWKEFSFN